MSSDRLQWYWEIKKINVKSKSINYRHCSYFNRQHAVKINAQKQDPGLDVRSVTSRFWAQNWKSATCKSRWHTTVTLLDVQTLLLPNVAYSSSSSVDNSTPQNPKPPCMWSVELSVIFSLIYTFICGPGSSVGIATDYGLEGPGSNTGGARFYVCPDQAWGPPRLLSNGYRVFPGGKVRPGRAADPLLVPRSWKSRAIPPPTLWATPGL